MGRLCVSLAELETDTREAHLAYAGVFCQLVQFDLLPRFLLTVDGIQPDNLCLNGSIRLRFSGKIALRTYLLRTSWWHAFRSQKELARPCQAKLCLHILRILWLELLESKLAKKSSVPGVNDKFRCGQISARTVSSGCFDSNGDRKRESYRMI